MKKAIEINRSGFKFFVVVDTEVDTIIGETQFSLSDIEKKAARFLAEAAEADGAVSLNLIGGTSMRLWEGHIEAMEQQERRGEDGVTMLTIAEMSGW